MSERKQNEFDPEAETAEARTGRMTVGTLPGRIGRYHVKRVIATAGIICNPVPVGV